MNSRGRALNDYDDDWFLMDYDILPAGIMRFKKKYTKMVNPRDGLTYQTGTLEK